MISVIPCFSSFLVLLCGHHVRALANSPSSSPTSSSFSGGRTYNYFAFGSNMASSTMINLRNLSPIASTAAVLPGHRLAFNIPGVPGVEPSSAAVEPLLDSNEYNPQLLQHDAVHGVLYKLSEEDFVTICRTEGVPFAYVLHRCRVIPYVGDKKSAGDERLQSTFLNHSSSIENSTSNGNNIKRTEWGIPAFTLRAARKEWRKSEDIPPSQSYLNVLIRGAEEFSLDEEYVAKLKSMPAGKTWLGGGLAEEMLRVAEGRKNNKFPPF
mmetsp:Transcript_9903/g.19527  ORF Transcript_9903/g.19527 Transcript_9903/m.19527 type:complete len:267 (+) Transcript_9903:291-1091(+)